MGGFGNIARTLGGVGNDVSNAQQANTALSQQAAADKLKQIMAGLQIQEIRNRLSEFGQAKPAGIEKTPEGGIAGFTFDPNSGTYKAQPLLPGAAPGVDKEKFRTSLLEYANRPDATALEKRVMSGLIGSLDAGMAPEKVMEDYNRFLSSRSETGTPPKDELKTEIFGGYRWQYDPAKKLSGTRDATGQYVRLGLAKEPGTGDSGLDLDALAQDVSSGRAGMPTGKLGAQLATRMKKMGLEPPLKKDIPPDIKNFLNAPMPQKPSVADSQRLASAADRVFGGTEYRQDLIARGRRSTLMGMRTPYSPQAYSAEEYQTMLDTIKNAVGQPTSLQAIPPPPSGAVLDKK